MTEIYCISQIQIKQLSKPTTFPKVPIIGNIIKMKRARFIMSKNTSISLGEHFDSFISTQLHSGRFSSTSEVVRAGLRLLEDSETKLTALREHLAIGEEQANRGEFADYSLNGLIAELDAEDNQVQ